MDRGMAVIFSLEMIFDPYLNSEPLNESIGTKILSYERGLNGWYGFLY